MISTIDPKVVKHVLKDKFNTYIKSNKLLDIMQPLFGEGIFALNHGPHANDRGAKWFMQRKTAAKVFTHSTLIKQVHSVLSCNCSKLIKILYSQPEKESIELQHLCFRFTLDTIGAIGFGIDTSTLDDPLGVIPPYVNAFDRAQQLIVSRSFKPFVKSLGFLLYKSESELQDHIRVAHDFVANVVVDRQNDPELSEKGDMLSLFINATRDSETGKIDKSAEAFIMLRDVSINIFLAGRDTTGCLLSFIFFMLSTHPEIQKKLFSELCEALGYKPGEDPDQASTPTLGLLKSDALPYLHGVVYETLRMFPPGPVFGKMAAEDDVLPDGTFVPKGTDINFEVYCMGRNEKYWGKDANIFKPERWVGPNKVAPTPFEMPVFQSGPRKCLGEGLAIYEAKFVTCELVRRFQFELARNPIEPLYCPGLILRVNGDVPVYLKQRFKKEH
jgi:hypothetical protein